MEKLTVAVFFGGRSPEHGISLQSAAAVLEGLDRERYRPVAVGISREGRWYHCTADIQDIRQDRWLRQGACVPAILSPDRGDRGLFLFPNGGLERLPVDVAFPVLHGQDGEDGAIQGLIQLSGIPMAGCGVLASALGMDKERARQMVRQAGIPTAQSRSFCRGEEPRIAAFARELGYPLFVKPARAGSSYGVARVEAPRELLPAVAEALRYDSRVLVEEAAPGFEVGCAVMGSGTLTVGAVDEIRTAGGILDNVEKYHPKTSATYTPARVPAETARRIQDTAKQIYRVLDCSGFARVDLFLTPSGELWFHEINTIPGFTPHSRFPAMMAAAGIPIPAVLDTVIQSALQGGGIEP